jgi:hypothetical protein
MITSGEIIWKARTPIMTTRLAGKSKRESA